MPHPVSSRRALTLMALVVATSGCSSTGRVRSEPVDLSQSDDATEPDSAHTAAPRIDWRGIPPERRRAVLDVLDATFCPACLCAESVAQCLTPDQPCGCPDCAEIMKRFVLDAFRQGLSSDEILDLSAEAWIDAFEQEPVSIALDDQPVRAASVDGEPISVVEFADFTCPHCASVAPMLEALTESRPAVRLTFFYYPLRSRGPPILAAQAAEEAFRQGRFWSFARAVYEQPRPPERGDLLALADQVGLDRERMASALDEERHRDVVLGDKALGQSVGVRGTPAIYIEGRPFVLPRTLDNLEIWVDMERTRRQCTDGAD